MPLAYDDIPGSWRELSEAWPFITFKDDATAKKAYVIAHSVCKIPYGSFVLCDNELRLETDAYKLKVQDEVNKRIEMSIKNGGVGL